MDSREQQRAQIREPGCLDEVALPAGPIEVHGRRRESPCDPATPAVEQPFQTPPGIPDRLTAQPASPPILSVGNGPKKADCPDSTFGAPVVIPTGTIVFEFDCNELVPALTPSQLNYLDQLDLSNLILQSAEQLGDHLKLTPAQASMLSSVLAGLQLEADTQADALAYDSLNCVWRNTRQEAACPPGALTTGAYADASNPVVIAAGAVESSVSQSDADEKAMALAQQDLNCWWGNSSVSRRCEDLGFQTVGSDATPRPDGSRRVGAYTVAANQFFSASDQDEANQQAKDYADSQLSCFFINNAVRADCPAGTSSQKTLRLISGSSEMSPAGHVVIESGFLTSGLSTEDATAQADLLAKSLLDCFWNNPEVSDVCPDVVFEGETYEPRGDTKVVIPAGTLKSYVDAKDAEEQAKALAKSQLNCIYCNKEIKPVCLIEGSLDTTTGVPAGLYCSENPGEAQDMAAGLAGIPVRIIVSGENVNCTFGNDAMQASCTDGGLNAFPANAAGLSPHSYPAPGQKIYMSANSVIVSSLDGGSKAVANKQALAILRGLLNCFFENEKQTATCRDLQKGMDTAEGAVNTAVTVAGQYYSYVSLEAANLEAFNVAVASLNCYYTAAASASCLDIRKGMDTAPDAVNTVTVPRGMITSMISSAAALQEAKAQALSELRCVYTNVTLRVLCTDIGKSMDTAPGAVNEVVFPAGVVTSDTSTVVANQEATLMAKTQLECFYGNDEYTATCSKDLSKNGVSSNSSDNISIAADTYISYVSKSSANQSAKEAAKNNLDCFWENVPYEATCEKDLGKKDVSSKSTDHVKVEAGAYSSYQNQAEADAFAKTAAMGGLICFYENEKYTAKCSETPGGSGFDSESTDNVEVKAGSFTSFSSQDEADSFAEDSGKQALNCFWKNDAVSSNQSCPDNTLMVQQGQVGAGIFSSYSGKTEANNMAQTVADSLNICMPTGLAGNDGAQTGCDGDCYGYYS